MLGIWPLDYQIIASSGFYSCRAKAGIEFLKLKMLTVSAGVGQPVGTEARGSV